MAGASFPIGKKGQEEILSSAFDAIIDREPEIDLTLVYIKQVIYDYLSIRYNFSRTSLDSLGDFYGYGPEGKNRLATVEKLVSAELEYRKYGSVEEAKAKAEEEEAFSLADTAVDFSVKEESFLEGEFWQKYSWIFVLIGVALGAIILKKILFGGRKIAAA